MENITPNGGSQSMSWQQTFEFDRYGNRNFVEANAIGDPQAPIRGSGQLVAKCPSRLTSTP